MNASAPARLSSANARAFCDSVSPLRDGDLAGHGIPVLRGRRDPEAREVGLILAAGDARARPDRFDLVEITRVARAVQRGWRPWPELRAMPQEERLNRSPPGIERRQEGRRRRNPVARPFARRV